MPNAKLSLLLSIHPIFAHKILEGTKKYEYRKRMPSPIHRLVLYGTAPIKAIVGIAEVKKQLCEEPDILWEKTSADSGIDYAFFSSYFKDRKKAYALKIGATEIFDSPLSLKHIDPTWSPPQSYRYITDSQWKKIQDYLSKTKSTILFSSGGLIGTPKGVKKPQVKISRRC